MIFICNNSDLLNKILGIFVKCKSITVNKEITLTNPINYTNNNIPIYYKN